MTDVAFAETRRDQNLNPLARELGGRVAEERAELIIDDQDPAAFVDDGDAVRGGLEQGSEV
jgi:hypothetical protein